MSRNALVVFGLLLALALAAAIAVRFGCDDAFISFQYSRSLVRGDGLTWFGDHIEGYTNFLWVLCALGIAAGVAPLVWAWTAASRRWSSCSCSRCGSRAHEPITSRR